MHHLRLAFEQLKQLIALRTSPRYLDASAHASYASLQCPTHLFAGEKLKQLIALRTSPRYLDRLAAGLQQRAGQEAKFHRCACYQVVILKVGG